MYHPYGDVGTLPWVNPNGAMEFGTDPRPQQLVELSQKIKTFTEGTNPESSEILEIRKCMGIANRVVFMGFAFHKLNMQLIAPENIDDANNSEVRCFATTYGMSHSNKEIIREQIDKLYPGVSSIMADLPCSKFFTEYWKTLSF